MTNLIFLLNTIWTKQSQWTRNAAKHDRIAVFAKNYAIILNSLEEIIIFGVVDVVPNFWTSYGKIVLIVTSATAGLCLVAIVILGIKHQRLYAMFLVLHNDRGVNDEDAPLFSYIAPMTATVTTTTQTTQSFWSPYEIDIILVLSS